MLTCKVGETIINCFDGTYDKHKLKHWSNKNLLICPDCNKPYEYCHGEIISPYFRHKEKSKECDEIYSEPETEEHIQGKLILYKWLLKLQEEGIVDNVKLESYIPETRQRPDIYFEQYGKRCVIEFQCTPISSEYLKRHELYQLAGVNDIWILGLDKYNLLINDNGDISHLKYYKEIEKHSCFYLEVESKCLFIKGKVIKDYLPYKSIILNEYYYYPIKYFSIYDLNVCLDNYVMSFFYNNDIKQKMYLNNKNKNIELILNYLINKYDFNIFKKYDKIVIDNLFKTRDIIININNNKIEISKEYWGMVKSKHWNGRKYATYYKNELFNKICETIYINDFIISEDILNSITNYINIEIEKSKRY